MDPLPGSSSGSYMCESASSAEKDCNDPELVVSSGPSSLSVSIGHATHHTAPDCERDVHSSLTVTNRQVEAASQPVSPSHATQPAPAQCALNSSGCDVSTGQLTDNRESGCDVSTGQLTDNIESGCDVSTGQLTDNIESGCDVSTGQLTHYRESSCDSEVGHSTGPSQHESYETQGQVTDSHLDTAARPGHLTDYDVTCDPECDPTAGGAAGLCSSQCDTTVDDSDWADFSSCAAFVADDAPVDDAFASSTATPVSEGVSGGAPSTAQSTAAAGAHSDGDGCVNTATPLSARASHSQHCNLSTVTGHQTSEQQQRQQQQQQQLCDDVSDDDWDDFGGFAACAPQLSAPPPLPAAVATPPADTASSLTGHTVPAVSPSHVTPTEYRVLDDFACSGCHHFDNLCQSTIRALFPHSAELAESGASSADDVSTEMAGGVSGADVLLTGGVWRHLSGQLETRVGVQWSSSLALKVLVDVLTVKDEPKADDDGGFFRARGDPTSSSLRHCSTELGGELLRAPSVGAESFSSQTSSSLSQTSSHMKPLIPQIVAAGAQRAAVPVSANGATVAPVSASSGTASGHWPPVTSSTERIMSRDVTQCVSSGVDACLMTSLGGVGLNSAAAAAAAVASRGMSATDGVTWSTCCTETSSDTLMPSAGRSTTAPSSSPRPSAFPVPHTDTLPPPPLARSQPLPSNCQPPSGATMCATLASPASQQSNEPPIDTGWQLINNINNNNGSSSNLTSSADDVDWSSFFDSCAKTSKPAKPTPSSSFISELERELLVDLPLSSSSSLLSPPAPLSSTGSGRYRQLLTQVSLSSPTEGATAVSFANLSNSRARPAFSSLDLLRFSFPNR